MKPIAGRSLFVALCAVLTLGLSEAAAQTPVITVQQNGSQVRLDWTAVAGATSYDINVSGTANGLFSSPLNFVIVTAPPGTYTVTVRGRSGNTTGPFSAPVTIVVGGTSGGCTPVAAPTPTVTVTGQTVSITWPAVPGTVGYRIQVGFGPGQTATQIDLPPGQTSYSTFVPQLGTFYGRVISANACGNLSVSAEQTFTIGASTPGTPGGGGMGNRTPDPAPGSLIPEASLGYLRDVVLSVSTSGGGAAALADSCGSRAANFVNRVLFELRRRDTRWGHNYKRGYFPGDLSHDIVAYNPGAVPDEGATRLYLFDIIGAHQSACSDPPTNPTPNWSSVTAATWAAGARGECANFDCARWTLQPYLSAGYPFAP